MNLFEIISIILYCGGAGGLKEPARARGGERLVPQSSLSADVHNPTCDN